jgi:tetratricopeptide (TPR) repeat protein
MIVRIYSKALQLDSTQIELYNVVGIILMNRRDYEGAALAFEQRFLRDPNATSAYLNYALCNTSMKRWEAAKTALRKVNEAKPDYIPGFLHLARIYMQQDSIEEAVEPYQIVVKLAEPQAVKYKAELGEAYRVIGLMHLVKKRHSEAVKALTASIKYQDNNPKAHLWLAQSYHALEKYEDAIREYRIVLKYDKNDKDAQKGLKLLGEEF